MAGAVHIGTSGWQYPHWKGAFYPDELRKREWFAFYRERFRTVEINNTFYNLPSLETTREWRDAVEEGFVYAVKASRYVTHMKKLKDPDQSLPKLLEVCDALGERLGPILFQLPPNWGFNAQRLKAFLESVPVQYRAAFEFRDERWLNEETYSMLREHGGGGAALVVHHMEGFETPHVATADFVYLRLHGPGGKYQGSYSDDELGRYAGFINGHKGAGRDVYCYFDNDENAYAAQNALRLRELAGA